MTPSLFLHGFGLSMSLIIAIGAQNAFVLKQGLHRNYVFITALICSLNDLVMFTIGGVGFGSLVNAFPLFTHVAAWGGAVFLAVYGLFSFRSAWQGGSMHVTDNGEHTGQPGLRASVLTALGVSVLNPHAWLDTVVLVGGIAGQHVWPGRALFIIGASSASFAWFFGLAYGAGLLVPVFRKESAWRVLDVGIGLLMWALAFGLARGELGF